MAITNRAPWRAVTRTTSARRERTYQARSPGCRPRLAARPTQPLTGRQRVRTGRTMKPRPTSATDSTAAGLAGVTPDTSAPHRPIQATTASIQRNHAAREIQRSISLGTGLIGVVIFDPDSDTQLTR